MKHRSTLPPMVAWERYLDERHRFAYWTMRAFDVPPKLIGLDGPWEPRWLRRTQLGRRIIYWRWLRWAYKHDRAHR